MGKTNLSARKMLIYANSHYDVKVDAIFFLPSKEAQPKVLAKVKKGQ